MVRDVRFTPGTAELAKVYERSSRTPADAEGTAQIQALIHRSTFKAYKRGGRALDACILPRGSVGFRLNVVSKGGTLDDSAT